MSSAPKDLSLPSQPRVAAIVPAYNEEETLAEVLSVLKATPRIHEILVVSDGSTDGTVEIARAAKLRAIHLRENHGKGTAMAVGVAHTDADILLFVDGDILNLTGSLLERLLEPVLAGTSDMNVGVRNRGDLLNARATAKGSPSRRD
jgi:glycosyltransferase involved in cell wall biosynthesis